MKPKPMHQRQREPQAAADRQDPAEQARAAVEEDREDHSADDQQQRLGQHDHAGDDAGMPNQTAALYLADDERVAEFRGAGPLDVRLDGRRP